MGFRGREGKVGEHHRKKGFRVIDNVMSLNLNVGHMGSFCLQKCTELYTYTSTFVFVYSASVKIF